MLPVDNSSIVSKRSVERLYHPDEPHFFRFFVPKFQRRAPLINRGYYLRLKAIDVTLRNFLAQPSPSPSAKTKCIVNLGAGLCVLPTHPGPVLSFLPLAHSSLTQRCRALAMLDQISRVRSGLCEIR